MLTIDFVHIGCHCFTMQQVTDHSYPFVVIVNEQMKGTKSEQREGNESKVNIDDDGNEGFQSATTRSDRVVKPPAQSNNDLVLWPL